MHTKEEESEESEGEETEEEETEEEETEDEEYIKENIDKNTYKSNPSQTEIKEENILKNPCVKIKINNIYTCGLIDTGASVSLISNKFLEENQKNLSDYKKEVKDASGNIIPIMGKIQI